MLEEECRDLFSHVVTHIFSHLLPSDPDFDFGKVIGHVPEEFRDGLAEAVEGHLGALLGKFSCDSDECSDEVDVDDGNGDKDTSS